MFSLIDFKDVVSELALHAESKMIMFSSGIVIFLLDANSTRSANLSSSECFLFFF